jgi:hypothetical protein
VAAETALRFEMLSRSEAIDPKQAFEFAASGFATQSCRASPIGEAIDP